MKRTNLLTKAFFLVMVLMGSVCSAWADTYKLTIDRSDFNTTSYSANNNQKTTLAVSTSDNSKTFEVKWTSSQIMIQSKMMQWKRNEGTLYNNTDLGTILSVDISGGNTDNLTTYYGSSTNPTVSTEVGGGFFRIENGDATTTITTIVVTFSRPDDITYALTAISNDDNCGTVNVNGNVITATPKEGCRINPTTPYEVVSGTASIAQNGNVFTVTADADCTIRINFEAIPSHTATFYANGTVFQTSEVLEGESVSFPETNPAGLSAKVFVGWTNAEMATTSDEAPELFSSATMGTQAQNYYAVYATFIQGDLVSVTDVLNRETTGVTGTSYSAWSGKTGTSGAIYAGCSAGGNTAIQLRTANSNSGIVSTTSAGRVRKVVVQWRAQTASGRVLDVYGSNKAYTSASNLYNDSAQGTLLGSIERDTETELTISGDYEYIGLRSQSDPMYLASVSITWESGTPDNYYDYCTTLADNITIGATGYLTYSSANGLDFSDVAIKAYSVKYENGSAKLTEVETVPAGAGVVLKGAADTYSVKLTDEASAIENNDLKVSYGNVQGDGTVYCLSNGSKGVGFYRVATTVTVPKGKCYLEIPAQSGEARQFIGFDDETTTAISDYSEQTVQDTLSVYNLRGQRVVQPQKGLYIVNGKKVVK